MSQQAATAKGNQRTPIRGRSKEILGDMSQPRIFSLQKLVEVADFNMDSRGRIVWANVWGVLSEHFSKLGAHPNRYVRPDVLWRNFSYSQDHVLVFMF